MVLNRDTLTAEICKNERLFDFNMAYQYFCSINMYRILRLNSHPSLAAKIFSYQTNHSYETRFVHDQNLNLPLYRLSKCQRSFLYNGIKTWKSLPPHLKTVQVDLKSFKNLLKNHLLS